MQVPLWNITVIQHLCISETLEVANLAEVEPLNTLISKRSMVLMQSFILCADVSKAFKVGEVWHWMSGESSPVSVNQPISYTGADFSAIIAISFFCLQILNSHIVFWWVVCGKKDQTKLFYYICIPKTSTCLSYSKAPLPLWLKGTNKLKWKTWRKWLQRFKKFGTCLHCNSCSNMQYAWRHNFPS